MFTDRLFMDLSSLKGEIFIPLVHKNTSEQEQQKMCIDPYKATVLDCCMGTNVSQQYNAISMHSIAKSPFSTSPLAVTKSGISDVIAPVEAVNIKSKEKISFHKNIKASQKDIKVNDVMKTKEFKIDNYVHISDRKVLPRAFAVLPTVLQYRHNSVSPRRSLTALVRFGPVQGVVQKIMPGEAEELITNAGVNNKPIFLIKRDKESVYHVNVSDEDKSNWLSLLPLGNQMTANVWLYEENNELYGITTKHIATRTPLTLGYSKKYAEEHQLPLGLPVLDLQEALPRKVSRWCGCQRALDSCACRRGTPTIRNRGLCVRQRRYRCSLCTHTFTRLFALKRHKQSCSKNHMKPEDSFDVNEENNMRSCSTPNVEDTRIPSDESLQNYTNVLDFSTNLFDTDRIPNLDISGNSRSEIEFNPYADSFKDDNYLENEISDNQVKANNKNEKKDSDVTLITCRFCNQLIDKTKNRQHLRGCKGRKLECKCGKKFINKNQFSEHLHSKHSEDLKSDPHESNETNYRCDECGHSFKRRGMFVNHLWRVHNRTASVPVERRVKHYPCVACRNIYRTAAKRDIHMNRHHPNSQLQRPAPIEGEKRACQPAVCPICPRQYMTRAKLLQHIRKSHPNEADAVKLNLELKPSFGKKKQAK